MIDSEDLQLMREMSSKIAKIEFWMEDLMGAKPEQCLVGKSVVLFPVIDFLALCDLIGGKWGAWAADVRVQRAAIQKSYDER
jgi:hypothetical protein